MIRCFKMFAMIGIALMAAAGYPRDAEANEWGALAFGESERRYCWRGGGRDDRSGAFGGAVPSMTRGAVSATASR